jgi:hypothetical protein
MLYSPANDVAVGPIIAMLCGLGIGVLAAVVFLETAILKWLHWKAFWPSVLASFVANLVSAGVGYASFSLLWDLPGWGILILYYIASVLIEGIILWFFKRTSLRETAIASAAMNFASYLLFMLPLFAYNDLL